MSVTSGVCAFAITAVIAVGAIVLIARDINSRKKCYKEENSEVNEDTPEIFPSFNSDEN